MPIVALVAALCACTESAPPNPNADQATPIEAPRTAEPPVEPPQPVEVLAVFAQPKVAELSCDAVRDITQDLLAKNKSLDDELFMALGACNKRKQAGDPEGTVVAVKQEDGKYFYDLIPKKTAEKATDICKIGAAVGATIIAAGEENITVSLYGPGGRACDELLSMAFRDNPMLVIDPVGAIAMNETRRIGKKALTGLKLYDNYQEATADLEDMAQRLHHSANKDIAQVKEWVDEDPTKALVYASNPMIGPLYEHRTKIGKKVGKVVQDGIDIVRGKK